MGQAKIILSLVFIGLFTIAVIGFAINFANDNSSAISVSDDPELSNLYSRTEGNVSGFNDAAEDTYSSILKTTIAPGSSEPQSAAPFSITPFSAINVVTNVLYVAYYKIFGTGTGFGIFVTTFIGILVFLVGLFIYKTLRGMPD